MDGNTESGVAVPPQVILAVPFITNGNKYSITIFGRCPAVP